jgi:hypothetical protein
MRKRPCLSAGLSLLFHFNYVHGCECRDCEHWLLLLYIQLLYTFVAPYLARYLIVL